MPDLGESWERGLSARTVPRKMRAGSPRSQGGTRAKKEDAKLEALLVAGLASGGEVPLTKEFWKELKGEAAEIGRRHHIRKKPSTSVHS